MYPVLELLLSALLYARSSLCCVQVLVQLQLKAGWKQANLGDNPELPVVVVILLYYSSVILG